MNLIRHIGFMVIGVIAFYSPQNPFNLYAIGFGVLLGLVYSLLCKGFIHRILRLLNGKLKKEIGKEPLKRAVETGGLFIMPFAILAVISTLVLGWNLNTSFVTTGVMAMGTAAGMEFGKLTGKPKLKNTIAVASLSWVFSTVWTLGLPFLKNAPEMIEGGTQLIRSLFGGL